MRKYIAAALVLSLYFLSGCQIEPQNLSEGDMVTYRIVIKSVSYSSDAFTVNYVFNSYNGSYLAHETSFTADYEGTEPFHILDWILSPDPVAFTDDYYRSFTFRLNEGEAVPATITFDTTKPIYMRKEVSWYNSAPGLPPDEKEITVAKAYIETVVVPVTIMD